MDTALTNPASTPSRSDNSVKDIRDDNALVRAIANERDRTAFDELFLRYQETAYNLALHIVQESALAEEAVQEAMLSIWLNPKPSAQCVREWVLGTVAGKSLNVRRGRRKLSKREKTILMDPGAAASGEEIERDELVDQLRMHLKTLPELESSILACCYVANMTHRTIAAQFGMPQRTITNKIHQALGRLRSQMTKAGAYAILPLINPKEISTAITGKTSVPLGLHQKVLGGIEKSPFFETSKFRRTMPRSAFAKAGLGTVGVVAASGALITLAIYATLSPATPSPAQPAPPAAAITSVPAQAAKGPGINARWAFENGPAADLKVITNTWEWRPLPNHSGRMVTPQDKRVLLKLPFELPSEPVVITLKTTNTLTGNVDMGGLWMNGLAVVPHKHYTKFFHFASNNTEKRLNYKLYVFDRYLVGRFEDNQWIGMVCEYPTPYPSKNLCLYFMNANVDEIQVNTLKPDEIPESLRDIPRTINELGVKPEDIGENGRPIDK